MQLMQQLLQLLADLLVIVSKANYGIAIKTYGMHIYICTRKALQARNSSTLTMCGQFFVVNQSLPLCLLMGHLCQAVLVRLVSGIVQLSQLQWTDAAASTAASEL
jgi:hypothetical protein